MGSQTADRITRRSLIIRIIGIRVMRLSWVDYSFAGGSDDAMLWRFARSTDVSASITPNAGSDVFATPLGLLCVVMYNRPIQEL